jgi:hypothetical protein
MADYDDLRVAEMPTDPVMLDEDVGGARVIIRGQQAEVDFNPGADRASRFDSEEHAQNLAETGDVSEMELSMLGARICEYVETDKEARGDWARRLDSALELLGVKNIPKEDLAFDGACAITHPLLAEAAVQFQARAIEEVFPSEGSVKTRIIGKRTMEREQQAVRVETHMNYQMVEEDSAYFWHTDQMLFVLPLWGSTFKKTYYDSLNDMVVSRYVTAEDFLVPYKAADLRSATRYTHILRKNATEMKKLMASGFYREVELPARGLQLEDSDDPSRHYEDAADDRTVAVHEDDIEHVLYECHIDLELDVDSGRWRGGKEVPLPYIVTVERETRTVLSVRRNWKEEDELCRKRVYFTHYKYLPGLGFYGFGLLHLMGSVVEGSSATMRALLDSAAFANMQGGFTTKEAKLKKGDNHIEPGQYKETDLSAEELSKGFYTPPFKEPSQALAKLFEMLVETGRRFATTTDQIVGDASNTGPVGTTLALIEQASKPFSGVHRRVHMAQAEEFKVRAELNFEFLPDNYPFEIEGDDQFVLRADYDGRIDVLPVSDPNIHSSTQRIAQAQALIQLGAENPDLYDREEIHRRFLMAMRVPDFESVLLKSQPPRLDPVTENVKAMTGQPCKAFPEQDHDAHLMVHEQFLASLNGNEDGLNAVGPVLQAHMMEHYALKYWTQVNQALGGILPNPDEIGEQEDPPEELDSYIAQMAAQLPKLDVMPPPDPPPPNPVEVELQLKQQAAEQEQEVKAAIAENEELRKQKAFEAEELRKQEAFEREQDRLDLKAQADADRKAAAELMNEGLRANQTVNEEDRRDAQAIREAGRKFPPGPAAGGDKGGA